MTTASKNPAIASGLLAPVMLALAAVPAAISEKVLGKDSQLDNQFVIVATISLLLLNMAVPLICYKAYGAVRMLVSSGLVALIATLSTLGTFYVFRSATMVFVPAVIVCTIGLVYAVHHVLLRTAK